MIERIVLVKLTDEHSTEAGRTAVAAHSREALKHLPGVRSLSVGVPADDKARVWDVSIVVRFDDLDAVEEYRVDPQHRVYVDEYLAPRMAVIKAWNFEVE